VPRREIGALVYQTFQLTSHEDVVCVYLSPRDAVASDRPVRLVMLNPTIKGGVEGLDIGMFGLVDGRSEFFVRFDGSEDRLDDSLSFYPDCLLGNQRKRSSSAGPAIVRDRSGGRRCVLARLRMSDEY
jgi:hypothetical protein